MDAYRPDLLKVVSGNVFLSLFAPSLLKYSLLMQGENDFMYFLSKEFEIDETKQRKT